MHSGGKLPRPVAGVTSKNLRHRRVQRCDLL